MIFVFVRIPLGLPCVFVCCRKMVTGYVGLMWFTDRQIRKELGRRSTRIVCPVSLPFLSRRFQEPLYHESMGPKVIM